MVTEESTLTPASKLPLKIAAIVAVVLGVLALISPFRAGIAATLVLAWSFLIGGCLGAYAAFKVRHWTGTYGLMLLSIVSILAGLYPGRIDLGLGRASGTDPVTTLALQRDRTRAGDCGGGGSGLGSTASTGWRSRLASGRREQV